MAAEIRSATTLIFQVLAYLIVVVYLLSGLDDLSYDLYFWGQRLRRLWTGRRFPRLTLEHLEAREQQKAAILIPAWREAGVIGRMLRNACETLRYRNYDIFVGTYADDPGTQAEVDRVSDTHARVHKVVNPVPGPTTKAHNLNHIYRAVVTHEHLTGQAYDILVCHDAEDVIHPFSLLLYNYLMPRKDMVQLPVFPVPLPLHQITYWTYADEFAENHTTQLLVRERMGGFVPSAGVGTAYTRRAFELIALLRGQGEVFSTRSLTEDYEFGLRLRLEGLKTAFVIQRMALASPKAGRPDSLWAWVGTQAMFPRDLARAIRQKTRWILGIALQSWALTGWPEGAFIRYNLLHDRKVVVTNLVSFLGYLLVAYSTAYGALRALRQPDWPPLIARGSLLWYLLPVATALMIWRLAQRFIAVRRVYGLWPACTSVPRAVWANYINFAATVRAVRFFLRERRAGRGIAWDKTDHEFPADLGGGFLLNGLRETNTHPGNGIPLDLVVIDDEALVVTLEGELRSKDESRRLSAIRRVSPGTGSALLPGLLERLQDSSWRVRAEACRTLGFLRLPEAASGLDRAAGDPVWAVRANAVYALAKLGDAGEEGLLNLLRGRDRFAREAALAAIEQRGFITRNLHRLQASNPAEVRRAQRFFQILEHYGPSRLAREKLRSLKLATLTMDMSDQEKPAVRRS